MESTITNNNNSKRKAEDQINREKPLSFEVVAGLLKVITAIEREGGGFNKNSAKLGGVSLIAVGGTSAGKSSLLESIFKATGLPVSQDACTMYNTKLLMVKSDAIPSSYRLILPSHATHEEITLDLDTSAEVSDALRQDFLLYNGKPDYTKTATLMVADNFAIQLIAFDTAGPRGTSDMYTRWSNGIDKLGGSNGKIILVLVKYGPDICNDVVALASQAISENKFRSAKIVVVITQIDLFLKTSDRSSAAKTFIANLALIREMFVKVPGGITIAVVQSVSSEQKQSHAKNREIEQNTLSAFVESVPVTPDVLLGVTALTDAILRHYVSFYDETYLRALKSDLDARVEEAEIKLNQKTSVTQPSSHARNVTLKLQNDDAYHGEAEHLVYKCISNNMEKYITEEVLPAISVNAVQKSAFSTLWYGTSKATDDYTEQLKAREYCQKIIKNATATSEEIEKSLQAAYMEFLIQQISEYAGTCPQLHNEIILLYRSFANERRSVIVKELADYISERQHLLKLKTERRGDVLSASISKALKQSGGIGTKILETLNTVVPGMLMHLTGVHIIRTCVAFSEKLNTTLGGITEVWYGGSHEEIEDLKAALASLKNTRSDLVNVVENFKVAKL